MGAKWGGRGEEDEEGLPLWGQGGVPLVQPLRFPRSDAAHHYRCPCAIFGYSCTQAFPYHPCVQAIPDVWPVPTTPAPAATPTTTPVTPIPVKAPTAAPPKPNTKAHTAAQPAKATMPAPAALPLTVEALAALPPTIEAPKASFPALIAEVSVAVLAPGKKPTKGRMTITPFLGTHA
jgi:hypothetical protein